MVELLGSIADEVHLLALNASIEAAGAGEYGECFRVVAQQINQLAKQATAQQRVSSTQVIGAVNLVEGVAQQNVTAAQQVVSSTSGLENLTHQLNEVLRQVKLAA